MVAPVTGAVPHPTSEGDERALKYMALEPGTPIEQIKLDRVFIGSCTNSRIGDLRAAASMIEGRKVASSVSAMVVPGSQQVKTQAEAEGLDEVFRAAGFDWRSAGCSMCLGMNPDTLSPGERCASTSQPQLRGPSGPRRAHAPRLARRWPPPPRSRAASSTSGTGARGHGARSHASRAPVSVLDRADVDTDQIIPKQFLKRVERTGFGEFLFYDWAQGARLGPAGQPDPRDRARTSAAGRRASTLRGRSRTTASGRSSRRRSPTSSTRTARRSGCCRSRCRRTTCAR